jgi:aryl-alcohol dehydrogenase-like predicted oxidoreductase
MERRPLGQTDMNVGVLGFGGAEIGFEGVSKKTAVRLLDGALDAGLNVIDTAECYENSEGLIGEAVGERRQEYYLLTKCGHPDGYETEDWRPVSLLQSIERSLRRLRTDYLDVIQLHSCSEAELHQGDVIEALQRARQRGYTRYIGYSGDSHAARYAVECGQFDTLQISISVADQEALEFIMPLARERNIGVIAKRPIANVAWKTKRRPADEYYHTYWERLRKLDYDFLRGDMRDAVATALQFTLSVPGVHTAIVGTAKPGRFTENAAMLAAGPLPPERFENIRARWADVADATWAGQI